MILVQLLQGEGEKDATSPPALAPRERFSAPERDFLQTLVDFLDRVCRANLQAYNHVLRGHRVVDFAVLISERIPLISAVGCVELDPFGGIATSSVQGPMLQFIIS